MPIIPEIITSWIHTKVGYCCSPTLLERKTRSQRKHYRDGQPESGKEDITFPQTLNSEVPKNYLIRIQTRKTHLSLATRLSPLGRYCFLDQLLLCSSLRVLAAAIDVAVGVDIPSGYHEIALKPPSSPLSGDATST